MTIGIIGALEEEVFFLKEKIENCKHQVISGYTFWTGSLKESDIVLLKCGVGKVNAAIGTTLLHQYYSPQYLIHIGSAGGIQPDAKIGDVIVATEIRYHDVDLTAFGREYGQIPNMPTAFIPALQLIENIQKLKKVRVLTGLIVSGDSFIQDVDTLRKKFPSALAVEMESGAIAQACYQFQIPFAVICSISDRAAIADWDVYKQSLNLASKNATSLILSIFKNAIIN
jgi:adenosylhomocysteine nucleosidase